MGVIGKLRDAIRPAGYDMAMDVYNGEADRYIVYNIVTESPSGFADNTPFSNTVYFQVHICLPHRTDYQPVQEQLRRLLFEAGFSYPHVALNTVETDTNMRHICLETNMESEV